MPDLVKYSEVTPTQTSDVNNNALVSMSNVVNNEYVSGVVTMATLGTKLNNNIEYATALQTTNKTIIGAINEVAQGGGGGGSSTLAGLTDVTLTTPTDGQALIYDSATDKWVNGAGGGGNANIWEGTQAEYDALVNKDPDTVYFITDTNGDGQQFQPVVYSLEEREIGVWTDGKPLYQKTVIIPSGTLHAGDSITDISGLGVDIIVGQPSACIIFDTGSDMRTIPFAISGNYGVEIFADKSRIVIVRKSGDLVYDNIFVTIRYTKTTDTAGSGQWTPQGVPAVHYSEDEQVVGTWIDGSTVYERVFDLGTDVAIANNSFTDTEIDASSMSKIISVTGMYSTGVTSYPLMANINDNIIRLQSERNGQSGATVRYVILRYTKSSS